MELNLKGRRVVVAGGSRGIGRSIALGFAEAGAAVSICARGADTLETTRKELAAFGGTVHAQPCEEASGCRPVRNASTYSGACNRRSLSGSIRSGTSTSAQPCATACQATGPSFRIEVVGVSAE